MALITSRFGAIKCETLQSGIYVLEYESYIHLEVAVDYSAMEFIQVLRRFFAVCGKPALFLSDNGTQLVEAERELREMFKGWQKKKLKEFVAERELIAVHYTNSASLKWLR